MSAGGFSTISRGTSNHAMLEPITTIVGVLFSSLPFLVGSALLLATAAGWYRRAAQASRAAREGAS